jgi:hypothetical protein
MQPFIEVEPSLESSWRAVILFGRNVASYKFALAKSLVELAQQGKTDVLLDELAVPYARNICDHLKLADKQGTFGSSRFVEACRKFNSGELAADHLFETTVKLGFNNVIDAFHVVNSGEIGVRFYIDDRQGKQKRIQLTDHLLTLSESPQWANLGHEVESRWRLVETAWELNLPRHVLTVAYEPTSELLVVNDRLWERKQITGCRGALNGYQKGKCFYCFDYIGVDVRLVRTADVDHFFPHALKPHGMGVRLDGVWNLVLACSSCNRGEHGKFAQVPQLRFLERLHRRNEFLIESHHPLRETLITQTGGNEALRRAFLQEAYAFSKGLLIHNWKPIHEYEPAF